MGTHYKYPFGLATMLLRLKGWDCSVEYVRMVLRGDRKANSPLAKDILRTAEEMLNIPKK